MPRLLAFLIVISVPVFYFLYTSGNFSPGSFFRSDRPLVYIGGTPIKVEVLDTKAKRIQGLSGRESLPPNTGALFIFDEFEYHGIWMKDMLISLDIFWIDERFRVVHIEKNVHPNTYPTVFKPDSPARFVLEMEANYADAFNLGIGAPLSIPQGVTPEDLQ